MQQRVDYTSEMKSQLAFALFTLNKINEIYNVLKPISRARDLGVPELGETPMTEDIAFKFKQFQQSSTLKECKKFGDDVFNFIKGYFKVTFELISELSVKSDTEVDRIENRIDKPVVVLRDFHTNPECAKIVYTLATRFNGVASMEDLQYAFPHYYDEMPQLVNNIISKWKGLIEFDQDTQIIQMDDRDYRDICALVNYEPIDPDSRLANLIEKHNLEMGSIYYLLEKSVPKEYIEFTRKKQRRYLDLSISQFPSLFSKKQLVELESKGILTAKDFLERDYHFLKYNSHLLKSEIIEAKISLAYKMKWNCKNFELDLIHPSASGEHDVSVFKHALKHLRDFFNKANLTYNDIIGKKEILLSPKDSHVRRVCYRIIAFVRDFSERCLTNEFENFEPYTQKWVFTQHLTQNEVGSLKIKKDSRLMNIIYSDNDDFSNSPLDVATDSKTPSGLSAENKSSQKNNSKSSSKTKLKEGKNE